MAGWQMPCVALKEDKPVRFSDLAHIIALALQPEGPKGPEGGFAYGAARVQLDSELPRAVESGELLVRNALTLGEHTFPVGQALMDAVVLPSDLRGFLGARGIGLRLLPEDTTEMPSSPRRQKTQVLQEDAILAHIGALGHDPKALPPQPPGKPGVKAQVRQMALQNKSLFQSAEVFKKAWERLRDRDEIRGGEVSK